MFIFDYIFGLAASVRSLVFTVLLVCCGFVGLASTLDDLCSFTSRIYYGYPAADRQPSFTVGKYDESKYSWKLFAEGRKEDYKVYYDRNTVSLDDKNGIATVLMKIEKKQEIDLYRMVVRFDTNNNEMLITDAWSNTKVLPKNYGIHKIEKDTTYQFLCNSMHTDLEIRKNAKNRLSITEFIAEHSKKGAVVSSNLKAKADKVSAAKNQLSIANGKLELLDAQGNFSRAMVIATEDKVPIVVAKLEEKLIRAQEKDVAVASCDSDATLTSSTRDNIQKLTLHKGQRYRIAAAQPDIRRYTLWAKDASGKLVRVVTTADKLIVPEDKRLFKISFVYNGKEYVGWVNTKNLLNVN